MGIGNCILKIYIIMPNKIALATISILTHDRHKNIESVNRLLTGYGHLVIARLGVTLERHCQKGCTGLIILSVEGSKKEISELASKLNKQPAVKAKITFVR